MLSRSIAFADHANFGYINEIIINITIMELLLLITYVMY